MIFADLGAGEPIFLDANPFVYHFVSDPLYGAACSQLLQRVEDQEIRGFTSTHVLTEMAHRIMTIEAIATVRVACGGNRKIGSEIPSPSSMSGHAGATSRHSMLTRT